MSDAFEAHVRNVAQNLPYPPTPAHQRWKRRRHIALPLRYAAVLLLAVGLAGVMIPDIRAAMLAFLRIGAVTVYLDGHSAQGEPLNLEHVAGEVPFTQAQDLLSFELLVPPDDAPHRVFVQDSDLVILVWVSGNTIDKALYQTTDERWRIFKTTETITPTQVGAAAAYWVSIQHPVQFMKDEILYTELTHFASGNVLGWEQNGITYRLETHLPLDEARTLAESLVPYHSIQGS